MDFDERARLQQAVAAERRRKLKGALYAVEREEDEESAPLKAKITSESSEMKENTSITESVSTKVLCRLFIVSLLVPTFSSHVVSIRNCFQGSHPIAITDHFDSPPAVIKPLTSKEFSYDDNGIKDEETQGGVSHSPSKKKYDRGKMPWIVFLVLCVSVVAVPLGVVLGTNSNEGNTTTANPETIVAAETLVPTNLSDNGTGSPTGNNIGTESPTGECTKTMSTFSQSAVLVTVAVTSNISAVEVSHQGLLLPLSEMSSCRLTTDLRQLCTRLNSRSITFPMSWPKRWRP